MLERIWTWLDRVLYAVEHGIILSLLFGTIFLAFGQVVARWLGGGWVWADELVRYFVLWLGVWGAGPATRHYKHIKIDVLVQAMPPTVHAWVRRFTDLLAAAVAFFLVIATIRYIDSLGAEQLPALPFRTATLLWPVAVGFVWIFVRFLADAVLGAAFHEETSPVPLEDPS